jgi:hypothetical protein
MFSILGPVRTREALAPVEKLTEWELFKSLASEVTSPNIHIHSYNKAYKAAHDFAAAVALAYRLSTKKVTNLDWKYEIHGLDLTLKHKGKLKNLWQ